MNRQYIGARYVPKFYEGSNGTEWDPNVAYEPLTIVTYLSNSYTSKKAVPASVGNPLANPQYWASTGVYNAQVEEYREEVQRVITDQASMEADIEALESVVNRKWALITDSYGNPETGVDVFPDLFGRYMGLTRGVNYFYDNYGGAGFVANTVQFTYVLDRLHSGLPTGVEPSDITDLIIAGGCNDSNITNHSQLATAIHDTVAYAKTLFPNAKIYIAVTGGLKGVNGKLNMENNVIPYYLDCAKYGAIPLQNVQYAMTNKSFFKADGIHPTQAGHIAVANALASAVQKGYCKNDRLDFTVTLPAGVSATLTMTHGSVLVNNNVVDTDFKGLRLEFASDQAISNEYLLCNFENDILNGNNVDWYPARINVTHTTQGTTRYSGFVVFSGNEMYIELPEGTTGKIIQVDRLHTMTSLMQA